MTHQDERLGMIDYLWSVIQEIGVALGCPEHGAAEILESARKLREDAE